MFLARRELRFAWGRFALMGSVIALVAVLTVMLSGLGIGLVDDGISGLRALPVTHLALQAHTDSTFSRSTIDVATVEQLNDTAGVSAEPLGLSLFNAIVHRRHRRPRAVRSATRWLRRDRRLARFAP